MKQMKYLFAGALMLGLSVPVMAQEDTKTIVESITKVIKSKSGDVQAQVKVVAKKNKKNADVLVGIGRAFYEVKDTANARIYA